VPVASTDSGALAEGAALKYLERRGLALVTRNYRCKLGELDLVMEHDDVLVFVEVRLRNNARYGDGRESVTYQKQRKLTLAAGVFLMRHPRFQNSRCRFDVVSVTKRNYRAHCEWIRDAFS
jgi:putative endonuclease